MSYIKPELVKSPKNRLEDLEVIYDGGQGNWSMAKMKWDNDECIGVRWNGDENNPAGNPQSRGVATWFILPEEIAKVIEVVYAWLKENKKISS